MDTLIQKISFLDAENEYFSGWSYGYAGLNATTGQWKQFQEWITYLFDTLISGDQFMYVWFIGT